MKVISLKIGNLYWGYALYGNPNRNPLLAIQRGPQGWLVLTRNNRWMSPQLRRWSEAQRSKYQ